MTSLRSAGLVARTYPWAGHGLTGELTRLAGIAVLPGPFPGGHHRRNDVRRVGVKLGAAPDAPQWGEVLTRTPSDRRLVGVRRRATLKFTCLSREPPAFPVLCGVQAELDRDRGGLPAAVVAGEGGSQLAGRRWPSQAGAYPQYLVCPAGRPEWRPDRQDNTTAGSAIPLLPATRTPGRIACERNHGPVLR
jgi:hypothetical protein